MAVLVRALDAQKEWTFGQGLNNYLTGNAAIAQDIQCNLSMFLGDCFFQTKAGLDWFNLLGNKNEPAILLAINAAILNTLGVTGLLQTTVNLDRNRKLTVTYKVQTIYSVLQNTFVYSFGTT